MSCGLVCTATAPQAGQLCGVIPRHGCTTNSCMPCLHSSRASTQAMAYARLHDMPCHSMAMPQTGRSCAYMMHTCASKLGKAHALPVQHMHMYAYAEKLTGTHPPGPGQTCLPESPRPKLPRCPQAWQHPSWQRQRQPCKRCKMVVENGLSSHPCGPGLKVCHCHCLGDERVNKWVLMHQPYGAAERELAQKEASHRCTGTKTRCPENWHNCLGKLFAEGGRKP